MEPRRIEFKSPLKTICRERCLNKSAYTWFDFLLEESRLLYYHWLQLIFWGHFETDLIFYDFQSVLPYETKHFNNNETKHLKE
jgi:hypothetical protein